MAPLTLPVMLSLWLSATPTLAPTGTLCVPMTDVCAPEGSGYEGPHELQVAQGGVVTLRPSAPFRALGALFAAQAPLLVSVSQWGTSDAPGVHFAKVTVRGELLGEQVLNGVRVSGAVTLGQSQGRPPWDAPQLLRAQNIPEGTLTILGGEPITLGGTTSVSGSVDTRGVQLSFSSQGPLTVRGLTFAPGKVEVRRGDVTTLSVSGQFASAQQVGDVLVQGDVWVSWGPDLVQASAGTLAESTPLERLGLSGGEAPAGVQFSRGTSLEGPPPLLALVCGTLLRGLPVNGRERISWQANSNGVTVSGAMEAPGAVVDGGPTMLGPVTLRLPAKGCGAMGQVGSVGKGQAWAGLKLEPGAALDTQTSRGVETASGTLSGPQRVDGRLISGSFTAERTGNGPPRLRKGTLAAPSTLDAWELPAGTEVEVYEPDFSFQAPEGKAARAVGVHRGLRVDQVTRAQVDGESSSLELARPWRLPGTEFSFITVGLEVRSGCLWGHVATAQRVGRLLLPAQGDVGLCAGALRAASSSISNGVVPTMQFGRYFGTSLVAGSPAAPPSGEELPSEVPGAGPGYWLQINSLCRQPAGIPLPPPPVRWVYLDQHGEPTNRKDRAELDESASRAGAPCSRSNMTVPPGRNRNLP